MKRSLYIFLLIAVVLGVFTGGVRAQCNEGVNVVGGCTLEECQQVRRETGDSVTYVAILRGCFDFGTFFNRVIEWAVFVGGLAAVLRFAIGTLKYTVSSGDPTQLEEARDTITYALLGLLIVAVAWLILQMGSSFVPSEWRIWFGV